MLHPRICEHIGMNHRTNLLELSPSHSNVRLQAEKFRVRADEPSFDVLSGCGGNQENFLILESMYILT